MSKSKDNIILTIDAYLRGHLSPSEKADFESRLKADTQLALQVKQQKLQLAALDLLLEDDLKAKLIKWDNETPTDAPKNWIKPVGVATVIVLLLSALVAYFVMQFNRDKTQILPPVKEEIKKADTLNTKPPIVASTDTPKTEPTFERPTPSKKETPQSVDAIADKLPIDLKEAEQNMAVIVTELEEQYALRGEPEKDIKQTAISLIKQKKYAESLKKLEKASDTEGVYLKAMACFSDKRYKQAVIYFHEVAQNDSFSRIESAEYYEALSHLALKNKKDAYPILQRIAKDTAHAYQKPAQKWLNNQ